MVIIARLKRLTEKEQKFIRCLIEGSTITDAYVKSYNTTTKNKMTQCRKGKEVWDRPKVQEEYYKLLREYQRGSMRTREHLLAGLWEGFRQARGKEDIDDITKLFNNGEYQIIQDKYKKTDVNAMVKIADQICKMERFYENEENKGDISVNIVVNNSGCESAEEEEEDRETANFLKKNNVKL